MQGALPLAMSSTTSLREEQSAVLISLEGLTLESYWKVLRVE